MNHEIFTYPLDTPVNSKDQIAGKNEAKITLVEYGDYQCPHCKHAYPIIKQLQKDFPNDLRFVFRNFPLTQIHQYAFGAAEAAELAGDYDKFWEMHDQIFENQDQIDTLHLVGYASKLGINEIEFLKRLESNEKAQKVKDDFMSGIQSGVNGTPSFFINGYKYEGSWDYDPFSQVLTSLINQK